MSHFIDFYRGVFTHLFEWLVDAFTGQYLVLTIFIIGILTICLIITAIGTLAGRLK